MNDSNLGRTTAFALQWAFEITTIEQTDRRTKQTKDQTDGHTYRQHQNERWKGTTIETLSFKECQSIRKRFVPFSFHFFFLHFESNRNDANRIYWKVYYCIHHSLCLCCSLVAIWWCLISLAFRLDKEKRLDKKILCTRTYVYVYKCVHGTNDGKLKRSRTFRARGEGEKGKRTESVRTFLPI